MTAKGEVRAYCPRCDTWRALPLAASVSQGKESLHLPLRVRCRDCREPGQLQVRPPVPTRSVGDWIAPPGNRHPGAGLG